MRKEGSWNLSEAPLRVRERTGFPHIPPLQSVTRLRAFFAVRKQHTKQVAPVEGVGMVRRNISQTAVVAWREKESGKAFSWKVLGFWVLLRLRRKSTQKPQPNSAGKPQKIRPIQMGVAPRNIVDGVLPWGLLGFLGSGKKKKNPHKIG
jgi:hypothetical protein